MKAAEVIVYVEGPSDKLAMEALLEPLLKQKRQAGVIIKFFEAPKGDKKESILMKVPRTAVNIVRHCPDSIVVAMPDLYPKNKGFKHKTFDELEAGILERFDKALQDSTFEDKIRPKERFKVFCFKHDLEALILASEEALKSQLGVSHLKVPWQQTPVEDLDHDHPPKKIVEELFRKHGKRYKNTVHARSILEKSDYRNIAEKCSQCFKPFVEFLTELQPIGYHDQHG